MKWWFCEEHNERHRRKDSGQPADCVPTQVGAALGHRRAKSKRTCVFCLFTQPMGASLQPHVGAEKVLGIKAKASLMKKKREAFVTLSPMPTPAC